MYATIRRYKTDFPDEVNRRVREEFVPLMSKQPGFIAYHGIDAGEGHWVSVSIFETEAGAQKSNGIAKEWVKNNIAAFQNILDFDDSDLLVPDITGGEVIASSVSKMGRKVA